MKNFFLSILLFAVTPVILWAQDYAPDRLLIQFEKGVAYDFSARGFDLPELDQLNKSWGLFRARPLAKKPGSHGLHRAFVLQFQDAIDVDQAISAYRKMGIFTVVEPDYIGRGGGECEELTPDDTHYDRQWSHYNDGTFSLDDSTPDADIDMDEAWDLGQGDPSLILAILDSGFNEDHPELSDRLWNNSGEIPGNFIDDDANGYVDDDWGWDFAFNDSNPQDGHGHGTNVAGIAAATGNNGLGYAGVDWNCQVMILKILDDDNSGFYSWWAEAIIYAVDHGASVINMSVGGNSFSTILESAVNYARDNEVVIAACMMNYNDNVSYYPAKFDHTIAVGSTDADDTRTEPFFWSNTSGSNYGSHIDVCGPGNFIYGLHNTNTTNYNTYWGGTSQATPLVAGLCALLRANNPSLSSEDLRMILRNTAEDQVGDPAEDVAGWDQYHGAGRINAYEALNYSMSTKAQEVSGSNALSLYPNPLSSRERKVLLQLPGQWQGTARWELSGVNGARLTEGTVGLNGQLVELDLASELVRGFYLIQLQIEDRVFTGKLLVE